MAKKRVRHFEQRDILQQKEDEAQRREEEKWLGQMKARQDEFQNEFVHKYLKDYSKLSEETADFYRRKAIDLYITEQFCKGNRYTLSKNKELLERSKELI